VSPESQVFPIFSRCGEESPETRSDVCFQGQKPAEVSHALQQIEGILHVIEQPGTKAQIKPAQAEFIDPAHIQVAKVDLIVTALALETMGLFQKPLANFHAENLATAAIREIKAVVSLVRAKIDGAQAFERKKLSDAQCPR